MRKKSYYNVDRMLSPQEWEILKTWRKDHPEQKWSKGNKKFDSELLFWTYSPNGRNGEIWYTPEFFEDSNQKNRERRKKNKARIDRSRQEFLKKKLSEDPDYRKRVNKKYKDAQSLERKLADKKRDLESYNKRIEKMTPEEKREKKLHNEILRKQRERDRPFLRLANTVRTGVNRSFKVAKQKKKNKTFEILGIDFLGLKEHFESLFEPWMNWENKATKIPPTSMNEKWDVDHIIPISTAKTTEDVIRLNHYTNLRPLCAYMNRFIKRDNLNWTV